MLIGMSSTGRNLDDQQVSVTRPKTLINVLSFDMRRQCIMPGSLPVVTVVPPMHSISGDDDGTCASHMVPLTAGMLGLQCRPCSGPRQLIAGDYNSVVANLGVRCCHIVCISGYARLF